MMIKAIWTLILIFFAATQAKASAAFISDENLIGKGEAKYMGFIKVYDAALYSPDTPKSEQLLGADISKCLKLSYKVSLSPEDFSKAADTVLSRQHLPAEIAQIEDELARLNAAYTKVQKGDSYTLCYDAATATTVLALNHKPRVSIVSKPFAELYFGIWLAETKPLDMKLRRDLLAIR